MGASHYGGFGMKDEYLLKKIKDRCKVCDECWIWTQSINNKNQPQMCHLGKGGQMVRRIAYVANGGTISKGYVVTAIDDCNNPHCCNPEHIQAVSRARILKRAYSTGRRNVAMEIDARRRKAVAQGWAKLNLEKVEIIRQRLAQGIPKTHIAREFDVSEKTIYSIDRGLHWKQNAVSSVFSWRPA